MHFNNNVFSNIAMWFVECYRGFKCDYFARTQEGLTLFEYPIFTPTATTDLDQVTTEMANLAVTLFPRQAANLHQASSP